MRFRVTEIAAAVGGQAVGHDVEVTGAGIDSREIEVGQLFVPIVAARDGHDFVASAVHRGAAAYLTSVGPIDGIDLPAVVVDDTGDALAALGRSARERLPGAVVGITGSVGKTTTKDLVAAVLEERFEAHANLRSFNNELGVPLTLLNAPDATEVAVIEMGARGSGHIAELCAIAEPTIGVVTTVELVHTELFGGIDAVATAKRELVEALPVTGTAVLFADNPHVAAMATSCAGDVITFGLDRGDVRAQRIEVDGELRASFRLTSPFGERDVQLGVRGRHNVANALAAACVGFVAGVPLDDIVVGLASTDHSPWRMDLRTAPSGALVLNDAYNAGPASTRAAVLALAHLDAHRRVAVLGTMAELGGHAVQAHLDIAAVAVEHGVEIIAVGTSDYGVDPVAGIDEVIDRLGPLGLGDAVLVKGSRVAALERVAHVLLEAG